MVEVKQQTEDIPTPPEPMPPEPTPPPDAFQPKNWEFAQVKVSDVDAAANAFAEARNESKKLKAKLSQAQDLEKDLEAKFLNSLEMVGKANWATGGRKFETATRKFYSMPKDLDVKEKLFNWIEKTYDKQTRDAYCTINTMAFNSLLKTYEESAPDNSVPEFIGKPFEKVSIRMKTGG